LMVASCGSLVSGYSTGASGKRNGFSQVLQPILVAIVITTLVDLAAPRRGLIGISQQSLVDLKQSLALPEPGISNEKP